MGKQELLMAGLPQAFRIPACILSSPIQKRSNRGVRILLLNSGDVNEI